MASSAAPASENRAPRNLALLVGGCFSLGFSVFQISAIWWPVSAIRYVGGPALMKITHPWMYASLCLGVSAAVLLFGFYGLSGAGTIRRLPLLRFALVVITAIYLARGLLIIPQIPNALQNPNYIRFPIFSAVALVVGVVHLAGLLRLPRQARA